MDEFQYTIQIQEIDQLKTLKEKEVVIRRLHSALGPNMAYRREVVLKQSYINIYKCLTKALATYTGKSKLPDFIYNSIVSAEHFILEKLLIAGYSYEVLEDIFQFRELVTIHYSDTAMIKALSLAVGDKPLNFKIRYNLGLSLTYQTMFHSSEKLYLAPNKDVYGNNGNVGYIFQIEMLKQSLPAGIKYTIIEEILLLLYSHIDSDQSTRKAFISEAHELFKNLSAVTNTVERSMIS